MSDQVPFNDISYANGLYNMDADPNQMIMMKASGFYTVSKQAYLDVQLVRNYAAAVRLGKVPFMYHFAGGADPVVEASYFISAVSPLADGDGYALDFEIDTDDNPGWVLAFLDHFTSVVGTRPWFYVDRSRRETGDWSAVTAKYGEWIAVPDVDFSADIPGIGVYIAQQGPIVNGVDTDMFFGTLEALKEYTYQTPTPQPDPTPPTVPEAPTTPMVEPTPTLPTVPTPEVSAPDSPVSTAPSTPETKETPSAPKVEPKTNLLEEILNWLLALFGISRRK